MVVIYGPLSDQNSNLHWNLTESPRLIKAHWTFVHHSQSLSHCVLKNCHPFHWLNDDNEFHIYWFWSTMFLQKKINTLRHSGYINLFPLWNHLKPISLRISSVPKMGVPLVISSWGSPIDGNRGISGFPGCLTFWMASGKDLAMDITSPTDFICVPRVRSTVGNLSISQRGIWHSGPHPQGPRSRSNGWSWLVTQCWFWESSVQWEIFRILKWSYCTIFLAIFWGDIPLLAPCDPRDRPSPRSSPGTVRNRPWCSASPSFGGSPGRGLRQKSRSPGVKT